MTTHTPRRIQRLRQAGWRLADATTNPHTLRVRVLGATHAARPATTFTGHVTACCWMLTPTVRAANLTVDQPADTPVTCPRCLAVATPGPDNGGAA